MGRVAACAWLAALLCGSVALAQEKEATEPAAPGAAEAPTGDAPKDGADAPTPSEAVTPTNVWQDIYVVPRRPVLKRRRVELMPTYNVTINSPLVRMHGIGAQLAIYLSESLFIGLEGTYYFSQLQDRYFLIGLDQRVLPSANKYDWSALLDLGYVPVNGKFTLFNKSILHWELYISAGVGVFQTTVIPKNPANNGWSNINFAGLFPGLGARMWVNRWFAFDTYFKNYIFPDNLEGNTRTPGDCASSSMCDAKNKAQQVLNFNMVFGVGLSFFLPPGFEYKTAR